MNQRVQQRLAGKFQPGEYPGRGDAERQADPDGPSRHLQAEQHGLEFGGG